MSKYKEFYITIADFAYLQDIGHPYEGFIIGLGYAFTHSSVINPPNFNGYSHAGDVSPQMNRFKLVRHQYVDNSPEMIERSINGITPNGAKIYIVQQGDTLTSIAREYRVSIENLIKWNKISTPDKLQIGQKLIVSESSHDLLGDYLKQNPIRESYGLGTSSGTPISIPQLSTQQIIDIISTSASIHGYLPKTLLYNQANENGCFIYKNGGKYVTRKMGYCGNQSQSAQLISNYKSQFNYAIKMNKGISALGTSTGVVSLGIGISEIQNGNIGPNSYNDVGVGALGVMASGASYFGGVEIPLVGEFVLLYGVMRISWDLGELYGPSKWPGFYRQCRERKRQEEFLNDLQKEINEGK
ncbi:LysM peptidoglycan-binding domain-containing protein [uncultured Bacteroides sp.]|uniref:LysM peptidoglycan-binding domain-containing protein n=1 Tax=uncultured Bacteroides sp. TaxID=162156 RepID=UPI0025E2AD6F|nr:LysM peptidoglycan-binding domain-containing protein [uncultured Bacteroides sp.]